MGNKVNKTRKKRGWRKRSIKRLHEELKRRRNLPRIHDIKVEPPEDILIIMEESDVKVEFISADEALPTAGPNEGTPLVDFLEIKEEKIQEK